MFRTQEPARAFSLGDIVRLIVGGPDMRVIGFSRDDIWCVWTNAAESFSKKFPSAELECA